MHKNVMKDMLCILLAALFVLVCTTQGYPLLEPDEARYTEIPREMAESGELIVPRLNGVIYIEKPPLFYWFQAASIKLFGVNEGAARFWNAFFASFTCMIIYLAGSVLYNRRTGWVAAALLFSSMLFYAMSHFITLDMTLSAFMTASLVFLLIGLERSPDRTQRFYFYGSYACAALAILSKGLVGILLPGAVFVLWVLATRRWIVLRHLYLFSGLALLLAIVLPWHMMMQERVPEFFDFYIIGQQFKRYLTLSEKRYQPMWFFIPILFAGLLPWTVFYSQALKRSAQEIGRAFGEKRKEVFLWIWFVFIFIFFSMSKSKLVPYVLPVLPPLSLLLAKDMLAFSRTRWEWGCTLGLVLLGALGVAVYPFIDPMVGNGRAALFVVQFEVLASILVVIAVACVGFLRYRRESLALGSLMIGMLLVFSLAIPLWISVADRSIKPLAMVIRQLHGQYDEVASFGKYYQDLPVYAQQRITLVDKQGELDFGITIEDKRDYIIQQPEFWKRWNDPHHRMLVVVSQNKFNASFQHLARPPIILATTSTQLLVSNYHPPLNEDTAHK